MVVQDVTSTFTSEVASPYAPDADNLACFQSHSNAKPFGLADVLADKLRAPVLTHESTYNSIQREQLPATLVLSFDISRLSMLESVCASWSGPLSAAVYLPLVAGNDSNAQVIQDTQAHLSELGSRCVRLHHKISTACNFECTQTECIIQ